MTTKSQMSSATLGSKNEDKTRKRKRPDSLDEDVMDRSKESQSRPGSVQRNRIARTQEDAESTIPTGRLSPSLFPKEDGMDLSKQLQSRRESDHSKKEAQKELKPLKLKAQVEPTPSESVAQVEPTPSESVAHHKKLRLGLPAHHKKLRFGLPKLGLCVELGDNRNYAKGSPGKVTSSRPISLLSSTYFPAEGDMDEVKEIVSGGLDSYNEKEDEEIEAELALVLKEKELIKKKMRSQNLKEQLKREKAELEELKKHEEAVGGMDKGMKANTYPSNNVIGQLDNEVLVTWPLKRTEDRGAEESSFGNFSQDAKQLSADLSKLPQDHPVVLVPPPSPDPPNPQ